MFAWFLGKLTNVGGGGGGRGQNVEFLDWDKHPETIFLTTWEQAHLLSPLHPPFDITAHLGTLVYMNYSSPHMIILSNFWALSWPGTIHKWRHAKRGREQVKLWYKSCSELCVELVFSRLKWHILVTQSPKYTRLKRLQNRSHLCTWLPYPCNWSWSTQIKFVLHVKDWLLDT